MAAAAATCKSAVVEFLDEAGLVCYGEVVHEEDGALDVYPIERTAEQRGMIWRYEEQYMTIDRAQVVTKITVDSPAELRAAWKDLGFVAAGDGRTLCLAAHEDRVDIPLYDESSSEDEAGEPSANPAMDGYESDEFVVPDDEPELFTFAQADAAVDPEAAAFIRETHEAVAAYDAWVPATEEERKIKAFIDAFEARARAKDSDDRLLAGKPSVDPSRPPLAP